MNHYEALRYKALASIQNQECKIFINDGMIGWLETISKYCAASFIEKTQPLKMSYLLDSLQSHATNILADMVFCCLKSKEAQ